MQDLSDASKSLHADRSLETNNMVAPPLFQSVTQTADNAEEFARMASVPLEDDFYTRYGNPTSSRIAKVIAELEGAEAGMMLASGMGAISTSILSFLEKGDHVIAQVSHYIGTSKLMQDFLPRFGVEVSLVKQSDTAAFKAAIQPNTKLIVLETPVNPTMEITDLEAVSKIAKEQGILTLCDNTFASPIIQKPIQWGIDLVLHSATKYIGGHHDLLAGCVVGKKELLEKIWGQSLVLGASAAPMNSWLALRGIRTLDMRVKKQNKNAQKIAEYLHQHPKISAVHYPGLSNHPQSDLVQKQMKGMGGGLMSFVLKNGYEAGVKFLDRVQLIQHAASLGGVDSIAILPAVMWGGRLPEEVIQEQGIAPGMIRFAVGIEDSADLIRDIEQALDTL
ncbi:MAG: aminotransferase class I/II-fold pyridoxal phosphate-dependent enzyme [Bacteroidota bacterium]